MSWAAAGGSGSPGGSDTQVQYNNNGAFGGSANFTFNGSLVNVNAAATTPTNTPFIVKAANSSYAAIKTEANPTSGFVMLGDNASATESFGTASIGFSGAQFVLGGCVAGSNSVSGGFNSTHTGSFNGAALSISGPTGQFQWWNASSATSTAVGSAKSLTQVMTLNQAGNLFLGSTSAIGLEKFGVTYNATTNYGFATNDTTGSNGATSAAFYSAGVLKGSISYNGVNILYNNTSDLRLKENVVDSGSGIEKLSNVKIRSFTWKDSKTITDFGVVAQELIEVAPEAVLQGDSENEIIKTWQVDTSTLVPAMIKAIQELSAANEALAARIAALEAK
jgi:hypothetical protein